MPILAAANLVSEMASGLIVGGEYALYNTQEFFGIIAGCLICILGILVLVLKIYNFLIKSTDIYFNIN